MAGRVILKNKKVLPLPGFEPRSLLITLTPVQEHFLSRQPCLTISTAKGTPSNHLS